MSGGRPFHFRFFSMMHEAATMKIGTDAMLLGAWTRIPEKGKALDIGTGSGILALMVAQRSEKLMIEAIDIDQLSVDQALFNFEASRWRERLLAITCSIQSFFLPSTAEKYQLILSNPPYFTSTFKSNLERKNLARHTDSLNHRQLIEAAARLLHPQGLFSVIIPYDFANTFVAVAAESGLFLQRKLTIVPVEGKSANRVALELSFENKNKPEIQQLTIRRSDSSFTPAYNNLLKDFYLGII
jgi:tRNA1Val (adenine37-N6)-methyltransferase